jgi:ribosome biogenesis GTPase A
MIVLNKADLAQPEGNRRWMEYYRTQGAYAIESVATNQKARAQILQVIDATMKPVVQRMLEKKGIRKTIRAMIVGIPNVGKSALINCLSRGGGARTGNRPGVTRGTQLIRVTPYLELLDTPGVLWPKLEVESYARHLAFTGSIKDEVMDTYQLSLALIAEFSQRPDSGLSARYGLERLSADPQQTLEDICKKRGWLAKGGLPDEERAAGLLLREFRAGKLGRVTLEFPPEDGRDEA